jgi:biopolymer transport protein ExbB
MNTLLLALALSSAHAEPSALESAYQKEFAFLAAEKEALQARRGSFDAETATKIGAAERELSTLEGRLLGVQARASKVEDALAAMERSVEAADDAGAAVESTLAAAASTVGIEVDGRDQVDALIDAYIAGAAAIDTGRAVRRTEGGFFLRDGTEVTGQIVRVGNVAAYGVSDAGAGALVPVGDGRLQLYREPAGDAANALVGGSVPSHLGVYLFESADRRITEPAEKTFATFVEAGGPIGVVIMVLGVIAGVLLMLRGLTLWRAGGGGERLRAKVVPLVDEGRYTEALALVKGKSASIPTVFAHIIPHLDRRRETLEDLATQAILRETPRIERFGTAVSVIAAVAPLLGLLGTVTGMIGTFEVITEFGTGDPKMLSGGISEALVTTQLGLIVAIPALLIGNIIGARAGGLVDEVERAALDLLNAVDHTDHEGDDAELDADSPVRRVAHG